MSAVLSRLYSRLRAAGISPGDSEELRLKKVILLFACGLMIAAAALWLALYQSLGLPVSASGQPGDEVVVGPERQKHTSPSRLHASLRE